MAGAITVEELQILITANYGDAIRGMLKMVDEVKQIVQTQLAPVQKMIQDTVASDTAQKAMKATEKAAEKTAEAVKKSTKSAVEDAAKLAEQAAKAAESAIAKMGKPKLAEISKQQLSGSYVDTGKVESSRKAVKRLNDEISNLQKNTQKKINWIPLNELRKTEKAAEGVADAVKEIKPAVESAKRSIRSTETAIRNSEKQMKKFGDTAKKSAKKAETGFQKFGKSFKSMLKWFVMFELVSMAIDAITEGIENMALASDDANKTLSAYLSSFTFLKNSLGAAIMPILELLEPIITTIVDLLAEGINYVGMFIAAISGQTTYKKAIKTQQNYAESLNGTAEAAEKAKYALAGFDEVNILDYGDEAEAIEKLADSFEEVEIPEWIQTLSNFIGIAKGNGSKPNKGDNNKTKDNFDPTGPTAYAEAVDLVDIKVKQLAADLQSLKLPEWLSSRIPAPVFEPATAPAIDLVPNFLPSLEKYRQKIPAPDFEPVTAPAINLTAWELSKERYQQPVSAPAISPIIAPALDLRTYLIPSIARYQQPIAAPVLEPAVVPALDTTTFFPSLDAAKSKVHIVFEAIKSDVKEWGENVSTNLKTSISYGVSAVLTSFSNMAQNMGFALEVMSANVAAWGMNVQENIKATMEYVPVAVHQGVKAAAESIHEWVSVTSQNVVSWGKNVIDNVYTTMKGWYETFVGWISGMWESFKSFMEATGEKISGWWSENKGTVATVAKGVAIGAGVVGVGALAAYLGVPAMIATGVKSLVGFVASHLPAIAAGGGLAAAGALADGGVITSPSLGIIGEYAGAKSNPEIVTPQNIMYDTVVEANAPLISALYDMVREIIAEIRDKDTTVEIDGDVVGSVVMKYIDRYKRRTGQNPV